MEKSNIDRKRTDTLVKLDVKELNIPVSHGENVKHYRKMKGYSQEYMATKLKISQSKYSEMERLSEINEADLSEIAIILNMGIEWLKDIPIQKGTTIYHQDGNGTNFQNTGDVNYTINNPVEDVKEAYQNTIEILERNFEQILEDKNRTIENLNKSKDNLLDRLLSVTNSIEK